MTRWITADQHLNHRKLSKWRVFPTVEEMNETLIANHNKRVEPKDVCYMLGDFTMVSRYVTVADWFSQLNGQIYYILGNHDTWPKTKVYKSKQGKKLIFLKAEHVIKVGETHVVLNHYPMRSWYRSYHGSVHLYGHEHGSVPDLGRSTDIGVDTNKYFPYNLENLVEKLLKQEIHPQGIP